MAIKEQDKVFYEELANGDKVINLPVTRVNNVEGLGRSANTAYVVGDVVYVDNNKKVVLKCTQAGTTSNSELNVSTASIGNVITDGTVKWQVCNRTSDVTSVNGKTGDVVVDTLPIGAIIPHSGNTVPTGFLTCNGAAVSRNTYADLFAVIGTTYGAGDGSTTFNLPNAQDGRLFTNSTPSIDEDGAFTFNGTGVKQSDGYYHTTSYGASYTLSNSAAYKFDMGSTKNGYSTYAVGVMPNTMQQVGNGVWATPPSPFKYLSGLKITMPSYVAVKYCIKY